MASVLEKRDGPYASTTAALGGLATITPDIPVCAVFIVLYIGFAATNMTIFQKNRRRDHKFVLSGMMFGFCMARITTLVLRIAWANRPHNVRLAIAAQIFVNAGILLIYIINILLSQRILRAKQPHVGWHPLVRQGTKVSFILIAGSLIMLITSIVVSLYTLNRDTRATCRDVLLAGLTYMLVFACLPLLQLGVAVLLPRSKDEETFGAGSMNAKIAIVTLSTCMCVLIAGFKSGANWSPPRPVTDPAWFDSKACFYVFNFVLEILLLSLLTFSRIDKRFHIPNGSTRPGDYTNAKEQFSWEDQLDVEPKIQA
ncbi:hypothetical protein P175DRAFT_0559831 [Aspergillus ochraceoroseus IBT 24754]|uniref:Integral membrane protein n=3 Tax=Aspergillus subgen. Nidulantes TaxID=2720870 RepID=A0A0F8XA22_9EURO|nr:uncharacterized protein P175DRAFT_0559831 [Aspergillus ochraceoroseus IBT 24754]KKK11852.1 hypothetical protein AOCH_001010 [Aspergillus ochraceoroseus]KKK20452.1 hypothetical protein ARAM_002904 [Aspergillus rambellii]PTU19016.1 hypothetical protein P175DRAFT_0559831 [Aspergillus ochraceoroseus IBT 24754]